MELLVLSGDEVRMALPMADAIAGMKRAFAQLSAGRAEMPLRSRVDVSEQDGVVLVMPAFLAETADLAVKVVSVFPRNVSRSKPIIHALVVALDADTGQPVALLEGGTLTAIRTGAASGAATDVLARPDAEVVAIIGSGVQARTQLEAVCAVRQVSEVRVFSLQRAHAEVFAEEMAGRNGVPTRILVMDDANSAVSEADIVCAATTSSTPVFDGRFLKPGAHVNGVGSFSP
ncbi:MAG: ornithine cyclodeaminase family protein, partial [Chloroflexi bacterium]